jgi:Domain of unknown function (DUF1996)
VLCLAFAGGLLTTAIYTRFSADAADGYDTIDALADAARIPNDQGPDICPSPTGRPSGTASGTVSQQYHRPSPGSSSSATPVPPASPSDSASPSDIPAPGGSATTTPSTSPTAAPPPHCGHGDTPPTAGDYVDIQAVPVNPNAGGPPPGRGASRGTFTSQCGTNRNNHQNPDNFIVAPGVSNGAHHRHEYVGNLSTDGNSTDQSLAAAGTTCRFGDLSTYYFPVLRRLGTQAGDARAPGGGNDGNVGMILRPTSVSLQFRGNARSSVVAMPRFLRIITGDAKAVTNGPANARAQWSCAAFPNRTTTKYPLCPGGRGVQRTLDFASCWDGKNTDSANHRAHIVFPLSSGRCPKNTTAVPQLRMTITYNVPPGRSFAVDSFPEQNHNPITDHADFEDVMPDVLMAFAVSCINGRRNC